MLNYLSTAGRGINYRSLVSSSLGIVFCFVQTALPIEFFPFILRLFLRVTIPVIGRHDPAGRDIP